MMALPPNTAVDASWEDSMPQEERNPCLSESGEYSEGHNCHNYPAVSVIGARLHPKPFIKVAAAPPPGTHQGTHHWPLTFSMGLQCDHTGRTIEAGCCNEVQLRHQVPYISTSRDFHWGPTVGLTQAVRSPPFSCPLPFSVPSRAAGRRDTAKHSRTAPRASFSSRGNTGH